MMFQILRETHVQLYVTKLKNLDEIGDFLVKHTSASRLENTERNLVRLKHLREYMFKNSQKPSKAQTVIQSGPQISSERVIPVFYIPFIEI